MTTALDYNGHVPSVAELMAQPSTFFEPPGPRALRRRALTEDEFNRLSAQHPTKAVELSSTHAYLTVGGIEYRTELAEVAC